MADEIDVQDTLVALIAQAVYPNGTAAASVANAPVKVFAGWPNAQQLDDDLRAGIQSISIYTRPEVSNTTRQGREWIPLPVVTPTIVLTVSGQTITVSGTPPATGKSFNAAALVNGRACVYAVTSSDTLTSIATALATLINAVASGTSNTGPVITLPGSAVINSVRVGNTGTMMQVIRTEMRLYQVVIWASTPDYRRALVQAVNGLSDIERLTLPDQSMARIIYKGGQADDGQQKDLLYRRDLLFTVDFATTKTTGATQAVNVAANVGVMQQITDSTPVGSVTVNIK